MKCLEVCHSLTSVPAHRTAEIEIHIKGCSACAEYTHQIDQFEKSLANALHVDVPEGLAYRILLAKNINVHRDRKQARLRLYGIAASVLLTISLVSGLIFLNHPYSLDQVALQHVQDELHHLDDKNNVSLAMLNNVLSPFNIRLNNAIGTINYAGTCKIRNNRGVHIVLQGKTAPVTLLIMPGEYVTQRQHIKSKQFQGVIVPIENGSIALIGRANSEIDVVEKNLQLSLQLI